MNQLIFLLQQKLIKEVVLPSYSNSTRKYYLLRSRKLEKCQNQVTYQAMYTEIEPVATEEAPISKDKWEKAYKNLNR